MEYKYSFEIGWIDEPQRAHNTKAGIEKWYGKTGCYQQNLKTIAS